jgi:hypothetical protein
LTAPLVTLTVFGCLGVWPFGAFRTNLFLLAYVCPLAAFGLTGIPLLARIPAAARVPALVRNQALPLVLAVVLPLVVFERDWHAHKRWAGESAFFDVVNELVAMQGPRARGEPLVVDHYSCALFHYYLAMNPDYAALSHKFARRFARHCQKTEDALSQAESQVSNGRVWLVLTDPHDSAVTLQRIASVANMVDYRTLDGGNDVLLELAPPGFRAQ